MSWFADSRWEPGAELHEGVILERRQVLLISLGTLAALGMGWPGSSLPRVASPSGDLAWDDFLRQTRPLADALVHSGQPDEEAYLEQIAALLPRVQTPPKPQSSPPPGVFGNVLPTMLHYQLPVMVMQIKLMPGAAIPYHDHRDYNGALLAMSGEVNVRSFEIVGEDPRPPAGSTFEIRETHREVLKAGRVATLTRTRDNIHDVRAGKAGAQLLDFFTFFQPDGMSVDLDVEERPRDRRHRLYEASWRK